MEHLLQPGAIHALRLEMDLFQSLFLWNIYFNLKNPLYTSTVSLSFQSLFLWNIYFNNHGNFLYLMILKRFNPYFYGTSTSTNVERYRVNTDWRFQSLFLWNIYFNWNHADMFCYVDRVSILIFMEHLLQHFLKLKGEMIDEVSILIFMEHLLQLLSQKTKTFAK